MASASKTGGTGAPDEPFRLPRTVTPHHYRLTLDVDLEEARFTGSAEIEVDIEVELDEIVLNAAELEIDGATLELGSETIAASVGLDAEAERATFALERSAPTGPGVLRCRFAGVLNDRLRGFYRSTFVDSDGSKRTIATTQMESTDARRAFPCWDEPDRKAVFEITLVLDDTQAAYSNSPIVDESVAGPGRKAVRFAPTMVMSSYLVAPVSYTHLDVYKRQEVVDDVVDPAEMARDLTPDDEERHGADRDVDVEDPPPRELLDKDSSEQWPDDAGHTEHRAEDALVAPPLSRRDDVPDDRLGADHQPAAAESLK